MDTKQTFKLLRELDNEWAELEVCLKDTPKGPEFTIGCTYGRVLDREQALEESKNFWVSFFEENDAEYGKFCKRWGAMSVTKAVQFVLDTDGEFHGLDVHSTDGDKVYVAEGWGRGDEMFRFFPEVKPYLRWHLNALRAGCAHQHALGWGHGKHIALTADTATAAQLKTLQGALDATVRKLREKAFTSKWDALQANPKGKEASELMTAVLGHPPKTVHDEQQQQAAFNNPSCAGYRAARAELTRRIEREFPFEPFKYKVFEDSLAAPCPECGYGYGTAWLYEELPAEVIEWAKNVPNMGDTVPEEF